MLALCAVAFSSLAAAQRIQCVPKRACTAAVQFAPTGAEFVAALGGTLAPVAPAMPIELQVHSRHGASYAAELSRSAWTPTAPIAVEARATISGPRVATTALDWAPLSQAPRTLFVGDANRTDLAIEYRLRVDDAVAPGTYSTTVVYHVWDRGGGAGAGGGDTITSIVTVVIPAFVALRLDGNLAGRLAVVHFDYGGSQVAAYLRAIASGRPLAFTSADFQRIEVATNNPTGYRVSVSVSASSGPAPSSLGVADVLLRYQRADGTVLRSSHATQGFEPLVYPADFSVHVDGSETPGTYTFAVSLDASSNP